MPRPAASKLPSPPPEPEVIPDLRELDLRPAVRITLAKLIDQYDNWRRQEHEAKRHKEQIGPKVKDLLGRNGITKLWHGDLKVSYYSTTRKSLSVQKLLEHGVAPDVIAASYDETEQYTLRVTPRKENGNGNEEI